PFEGPVFTVPMAHISIDGQSMGGLHAVTITKDGAFVDGVKVTGTVSFTPVSSPDAVMTILAMPEAGFVKAEEEKPAHPAVSVSYGGLAWVDEYAAMTKAAQKSIE